MNNHLPKCMVCGQPINYNDRLTMDIKTYHKSNKFTYDEYTNCVHPKVIKRYDYHKHCYKEQYPYMFAKLEDLL